MLPYDVARTLSIVGQLAQGKQLQVGRITIAMGEDMTIGMVLRSRDGDELVTRWDDLSLRILNKLLTEHNIGMAISNIPKS